jgi:ketosteroid isomerase-like protein
MPSPLESLLEYYRAFSTLDVSAFVSYFCEPSLTIARQGVFSAANRGTQADSFAPIVESLKARGYGRSEFVDAQITMLGETDALVRGVAVRYTAAGSELERIRLSYLMHRNDAGWRIAVLVAES